MRRLRKELRRHIRNSKTRMWFLVCVVVLFALYEIWSWGYNSHKYVTGEFSKYCYEIDNVPNTIKKPIYFDNKRSCEKFIESHETRRDFRDEKTKIESGVIYLTD